MAKDTPSNRPDKPEGIWWVLDRIQDDLDRMDSKWDENIATMTRVTENMTVVSGRVQQLSKLLTVDNGKPSVLTQVTSTTRDVQEIKAMIHELKEGLETVKAQTGSKTPKEVQVEKLKTIGKFAGVTALIIPGLLSFLNDFLGM